MTRRLIQLFFGLALYGFSTALMVRAGLGLDPWDVFHQGLSNHSGLSLGTIVILIGAAVLLLWIPLRQKPGIGTISNVILIGLWTDLGLWLIPPIEPAPLAVTMLLLSILLNGIAGAAYIGAGLGPGPRDGLMTGLVRRTGFSVRLVRTGIELVVVAAGWALGGTLGLGTLLYAVSIGPILHWLLPPFTIADDTPERAPAAATPEGRCPEPR